VSAVCWARKNNNSTVEVDWHRFDEPGGRGLRFGFPVSHTTALPVLPALGRPGLAGLDRPRLLHTVQHTHTHTHAVSYQLIGRVRA
jgi:hypothetical protein